MTQATLLEIDDLHVAYRTSGGPVPAVAGASLSVARGEVVALVGESGSGKSSLAHAVIGLLPEGGRVTGGRVRLAGQELTGRHRRSAPRLDHRGWLTSWTARRARWSTGSSGLVQERWLMDSSAWRT